VDKICELDMGDGHDCGLPAVYVVWAGPYGSDLKPFYACQDHPQQLYMDLTQDGFRVQEPTPL
jgi:hypothetical protein